MSLEPYEGGVRSQCAKIDAFLVANCVEATTDELVQEERLFPNIKSHHEDYVRLQQARIEALLSLDADRVKKIESMADELAQEKQHVSAQRSHYEDYVRSLQAKIDALLSLDADRVKKIEAMAAELSKEKQHVCEIKTRYDVHLGMLKDKVQEMTTLNAARVQQIEAMATELVEEKASYAELQTHYRDLHLVTQKLEPLARGKEMVPGPPIVVVYSLPKSGSQTIVRSLQKHADQLLVQHSHALSNDGIIDLFQETTNSLPDNRSDAFWIGATWNRFELLKQTLVVRQDMLNEMLRQDGRRPFLICGVREPVAFFLSFIFQWQGQRDDEGSAEGAISLERLVTKLDQFFPETATGPLGYLPEPGAWVKREIVEFLSVNPFTSGFDRQRGYQIYDSPRGKLLIYRMEDLSRIFKPALKELLGPLADGVEREDANTAEGKDYKADYDWVRANFKVPEALLDRIYGSAYAQTFYTEDEIAAFRARWRQRS